MNDENTEVKRPWTQLKKEKVKISKRLFKKYPTLENYKNMELYVDDIGEKGKCVKLIIKFLECNIVEENLATVEDLTFVAITESYGNVKVFIEGKSQVDNILRGMSDNNLVQMQLPASHSDESSKKKKKKKSESGRNTSPNKNKTKNALDECLYDSYKCNTFDKVIHFLAKSLADDHSSAPILPPDVITFNEIKYRFTSAKEARLWYNCDSNNICPNQFICHLIT